MTQRPHDGQQPTPMRSAGRWRRASILIGVGVVALMLPAFISPARRYDPAPYLAELSRSATLSLSAGSTPLQADLTIRNARMVDANGVRGPTHIRIEAGRITAIGDDIAAGTHDLDVRGASVIPGLIDAHVHLSLTPGGLTRMDDAETTRSLRLHHLRAYLACGVTTIFDPAVDNAVMADVYRSLALGHPGPRYLAVGTPMTVTGGYFEALFPPGIQHPSEVGPRLDALVKAGGVGVKLSFEPGYVAPVWRLHPPEIERAIVEEAHKRDLPLYVHVEQTDMARRALALAPHALVHAPIDGTKELAAEIAKAKVTVITTLALFDAHAIVFHPEQFETMPIRRVVPELELSSLDDPNQYQDHVYGLLSEVTPFIRGYYRAWLASLLTTQVGLRLTDKSNQKAAESAMQSVRYLRDAGVNLVVGSDSGNWPLFPYYFHGPTTWRELGMLAEAGLSPQEILAAATINAANLLGISKDVGTIDVGKVADLVVVQNDPLVSVLEAMRTIQYTVRAGVVRTPDEWMASR